MAALFASGRIVDAILVLVALEALGTPALAPADRARARSGPLLCNLASGAALMLARAGGAHRRHGPSSPPVPRAGLAHATRNRACACAAAEHA